MLKSHDDFLFALRVRESGNKYGEVNSLNYLGAYQFGEIALRDIGFYRLDGTKANDWKDGFWTGRYGIDNKEEFLKNHDAQDKAVDLFHKKLFSYIDKVVQYDGQKINGIDITVSSLIAGAHLVGNGSEVKYLLSDKSGLVPKDGNKTLITEYWKLFSGYDMPFKVDHNKNENILGSPGKDVLYGKGGIDTIDAGAGNDRIYGGDGADKLIGGEGNDTFVFKSKAEAGDSIIDFTPGSDNIMLSGKAFSLDSEVGPIVANIFVPISSFSDSKGIIAFEVNTGKVYAGLGGEAVHVATIHPGMHVEASDFHII